MRTSAWTRPGRASAAHHVDEKQPPNTGLLWWPAGSWRTGPEWAVDSGIDEDLRSGYGICVLMPMSGKRIGGKVVFPVMDLDFDGLLNIDILPGHHQSGHGGSRWPPSRRASPCPPAVCLPWTAAKASHIYVPVKPTTLRNIDARYGIWSGAKDPCPIEAVVNRRIGAEGGMWRKQK